MEPIIPTKSHYSVLTFLAIFQVVLKNSKNLQFSEQNIEKVQVTSRAEFKFMISKNQGFGIMDGSTESIQ